VQFYGVAISTLVALHLVTFGVYSLYWFYRHWLVRKRAGGMPVSPFWRAIFAILFVHRLFRAIDRGARMTRVRPAWNPNSQANAYVLLVLAGRVTAQLSSDDLSGILIDLALSAASLVPLVAAQRVANLANRRSDEAYANQQA
jgi:hypothetical protein